MRFALRGPERGLELGRLLYQAHPFAAAPRRGLQQNGEAQARRLVAGAARVRHHLARARHDRHAGRLHAPPRFGLVPHRLDCRGRRSDEHQAGARHRVRERRALGEEPVPGMDRLAAGGTRRFDQAAHVQVGIDRGRRPDRDRELRGAYVRRQTIRLGIDGDRLQPLFVTGADDAEGDLAAVGDEHAGDVGHQPTPSADNSLRRRRRRRSSGPRTAAASRARRGCRARGPPAPRGRGCPRPA